MRVLLKREDLTHTGSHKINNVLGQALLTRRMGKERVIAETGAGQHGVATATAAALFGLDCMVFMGAVDVERQALNVFRMKLLGAEVVPVDVRQRDAQGRDQRGVARLGRQRRHDALLHRLRRRPASVSLDGARVPADRRRRGTRAVPADPRRDRPRFRRRVRRWGIERDRHVRRLPRHCRTCAWSASRRAGSGSSPGKHGASVNRGVPGVLHGARSLFLQDEDGQIREAHSISAGLDYPGVGPEHAQLAATGRAEYPYATDDEAVAGFQLLSVTEGIVPALEPAHAIGVAGA